MLFTSPHAGWRGVLRELICFHSPSGPAHTSSGCENDSRIIAEVLPSAANDTMVPQPLALSLSGFRHSASILPLVGSTVAMPLSPSTSSPKRILDPPEVHVSQLAEAFISGVTLRACPPSAETTKMSP